LADPAVDEKRFENSFRIFPASGNRSPAICTTLAFAALKTCVGKILSSYMTGFAN
jgi:hypothetical protein